jgi:hypothetical protein
MKSVDGTNRPPSDKLPHEIFTELEALPKPKRAAFLKENESFVLKTILQGAFNSKIALDLPEGEPPYEKDQCPAGMSMARLSNTIKVLGKLVVGDTRLSKLQKEVTFVKLLEGVNEPDAQILIAMKDKTLGTLYPSLDVKLVQKVFPEIL